MTRNGAIARLRSPWYELHIVERVALEPPEIMDADAAGRWR